MQTEIREPDPAYERKYLNIVKEIVLSEYSAYNCSIFLFGSRANGKDRWASDYDIGVSGLDAQHFDKIKYRILEIAEESIVPWKIDLINFDIASDEFRKTALRHIITWKGDPPEAK